MFETFNQVDTKIKIGLTWKSERVPLHTIVNEHRNAEDVTVAGSNPITVVSVDSSGVAEKFFQNYIEQVASNPAVSVDAQDSAVVSSQTEGVNRSFQDQSGTTLVLKTNGSEMIVELEGITVSDVKTSIEKASLQNGNEIGRGWFKKLKKAIRKVVTIYKKIPLGIRWLYWFVTCIPSAATGIISVPFTAGIPVGPYVATIYCGATMPRSKPDIY